MGRRGTMKRYGAAAAAAVGLLAAGAGGVAGQATTDLLPSEIIALPQFADEFTILNAMIERWFPDGTGLTCDTPVTVFAPADTAWDASWLGVPSNVGNSATDTVEELVNYYSIPDVLFYHVIGGAYDKDQLVAEAEKPGKSILNSQPTNAGSPFEIVTEEVDGATFPALLTPLGQKIVLGSDVTVIEGCGGTQIYVLTEETIFPPGAEPNTAVVNGPDYFSAPNATSSLTQVGSQQTDFFTDSANNQGRGLPVCIIAGQRAPFASCSYPPATEILGFCPELAFGAAGRDPTAQEMNSQFQSTFTLDSQSTIAPTCPLANYGPAGVTFSLTLLDFCGLVSTVDSVDALTLFLPTNAAWLKAIGSAVPPTTPSALFTAPYSDWICTLIAYHAVPETVQYFGAAGSLAENGLVLPTLAGDNFGLEVRRRGMETKINQSNVTFLSTQSNGVAVYRIDYPLSPAVGASLESPLSTPAPEVDDE